VNAPIADNYVPPPMPHDLDAERAVIASMLLDCDCIPLVLSRLNAGDFYHPKHALVFDVIAELDRNKTPIDITTVAAVLRSRDRINTVGGAQFLGELTDVIPTTAHVEAHAKIVTDFAAARHAIEGMEALIAMARRGYTDPRLLASKLGKLALEVTRSDQARATMPVADVLETMFDGIGEEPVGAIDWPWAECTQKFGPFLPSECVLVSAEPATGKSSLVLMLAIHAAKRGKHVLYFSFEMSREELGRRMLAQESSVPEGKMLGRQGAIEAHEMVAMQTAGRCLAGLSIALSDDPAVTLLRLRAEIQFALATKGCDMVVVDYLQLIQKESDDKEKNETTRLEALSRGLKALAQEFKIVMIVVSSLNDTKGQKGAPVMGNLRGSRSLGFDANKIFMLYTEDEIDEENPPPVMDVKVKARKNRAGQRNATATLRFYGALYRFAMPEEDIFAERPDPVDRHEAERWAPPTRQLAAPSPVEQAAADGTDWYDETPGFDLSDPNKPSLGID
jgi:replicative DNA helicase